jgi:hypothetical protein
MIPFEEYERELVDREEMISAVGAFLYTLLTSGRLQSHDAEAALRVVEDLTPDKQAELFTSPAVLYYSRDLAGRLLNELCQHEGPHLDGEWPGAAN